MSALNIFKWQNFQSLKKIYKQHGTLLNCCKNIILTDGLKWGTLIGEDQLGNKYYQNNFYFFGTNRWVIYNPKFGLNYDASLIPAEWFGWLHYKTEYTPCEDPCRPKYKWMGEHTQNLSGSNKQYVPYTTRKEKIQAWKPNGNV